MLTRYRDALLISPVGLGMVLVVAFVPPIWERLAARGSARAIRIPEEQYAYGTLKPIFVRSEGEWHAYLKQLKSSDDIFQLMEENNFIEGFRDWADWLAFEEAVKNANVSYPDEVLVVVPYRRGSSSVEHSASALRLAARKLWFNVSRTSPGASNTDLHYGCYAFAVRVADVDQVEMRVDGALETVIDLK